MNSTNDTETLASVSSLSTTQGEVTTQGEITATEINPITYPLTDPGLDDPGIAVLSFFVCLFGIGFIAMACLFYLARRRIRLKCLPNRINTCIVPPLNNLSVKGDAESSDKRLSANVYETNACKSDGATTVEAKKETPLTKIKRALTANLPVKGNHARNVDKKVTLRETNSANEGRRLPSLPPDVSIHRERDSLESGAQNVHKTNGEPDYHLEKVVPTETHDADSDDSEIYEPIENKENAKKDAVQDKINVVSVTTFPKLSKTTLEKIPTTQHLVKSRIRSFEKEERQELKRPRHEDSTRHGNTKGRAKMPLKESTSVDEQTLQCQSIYENSISIDMDQRISNGTYDNIPADDDMYLQPEHGQRHSSDDMYIKCDQEGDHVDFYDGIPSAINNSVNRNSSQTNNTDTPPQFYDNIPTFNEADSEEEPPNYKPPPVPLSPIPKSNTTSKPNTPQNTTSFDNFGFEEYENTQAGKSYADTADKDLEEYSDVMLEQHSKKVGVALDIYDNVDELTLEEYSEVLSDTQMKTAGSEENLYEDYLDMTKSQIRLASSDA